MSWGIIKRLHNKKSPWPKGARRDGGMINGKFVMLEVYRPTICFNRIGFKGKK